MNLSRTSQLENISLEDATRRPKTTGHCGDIGHCGDVHHCGEVRHCGEVQHCGAVRHCGEASL